MKKVIAFDLDDTLAITKSPVSDTMGVLLVQLLDKYEVCVISGGQFGQFQKQIIDRIEATPAQLRKLHVMPTCGTRYYRYNDATEKWDIQYSEDLTKDQRELIATVLEAGAKKLGIWEENPAGEVIEDRGSQVTFSALGQQATPEDKYKWDADGKKKWALRDYAAPLLLDFEVRAGGTTSIDVTRVGIDKAYGMEKLIDILQVTKEDVLFVGDKLQEGGNDYPVKAMGIETIAVEKWEDTALVIEAICKL